AAQRVVLVGLGKAAELSARRYAAVLAGAAGALAGFGNVEAATTLAEIDVAGTTLRQRARQIAMAAGYAAYRYDATCSKTDTPRPAGLGKLVLAAARADSKEAQAGLREGAAIASGMTLARNLGNLPPNICTPTYLAETARSVGAEFKFKVEVLERKQLEALRMGSFLSVAKGSDEPPRFIVMHYQGAKPAGRGARA